MKRKQLIIGAVAIIILIVLFFVMKGFSSSFGPQEVSMSEPTDVVTDFYRPWLDALNSTTTNPFKEDLVSYPYLSPELRTQIKKAPRGEGEVDPVMCQLVTPPDFSTRTVSATEEQVEILVMSRPSGPPEQAVVTVLAKDGGWYIDSIRCTGGEVPPEREFSFDNEGFLMKDVPAPLNSAYWHLIFTENGEMGHYAPLIFTAESICIARDKSQTACDTSTFTALSEAHVQGQMTETGVNVTRVTFKK